MARVVRKSEGWDMGRPATTMEERVDQLEGEEKFPLVPQTKEERVAGRRGALLQRPLKF